jgi:hypothetical protein
MSIRPEVRQLLDLGPLPDSSRVAKSRERLERYQHLIETIEMPVSNEEAEALATLFGPDDCFGLAGRLCISLSQRRTGRPCIGYRTPTTSGSSCFDPVPNGELTLTIPSRPPYAATAEEGRQERIVG